MLEALARGLRQAGGILSPGVSRLLGDESLADDAARRQFAMQAYQQRLADERERALAGAVGPALQGGDLEAAARAAAGSGAPGGTRLALDLLGKAEERKARQESVLIQHRNRVSEIELRTQAELQRARENRESQERMAQILEAGRNERAQADREARESLARLAASLRQPPQPPQPQLVTNEQGVFQVDRSGNAVPVRGPDGAPLPGKPAAPEKALPTSAAQKLFENQTNLRRAEQALALMEGKGSQGDAEATGWKGFLPDAWLQRLDSKGVDARAALADLGSLVIHDRSGAAVTAAEFPRLRPFIPQVTDAPEVARKKLKRFAEVYRSIVEDTRAFYKESGYRVPDVGAGVGPAVPPPPSGFKVD